jgi:hypothetical protein
MSHSVVPIGLTKTVIGASLKFGNEQRKGVHDDHAHYRTVGIPRKQGMTLDDDFVRVAVQVVMQALIDLETSARVGAERYERSPERVTQRNGSRERQWETRVGAIPLRIPRLREGSHTTSLLEPRWSAPHCWRNT